MATPQNSQPVVSSGTESQKADTAFILEVHCDGNSEAGEPAMDRLEDNLVLVMVGEPSLYNKVLVLNKKETNS